MSSGYEHVMRLNEFSKKCFLFIWLYMRVLWLFVCFYLFKFMHRVRTVCSPCDMRNSCFAPQCQTAARVWSDSKKKNVCHKQEADIFLIILFKSLHVKLAMYKWGN